MTDPSPCLRERKKTKLRRAIQTAALRLFETQGYEHTTVEQIAEVAETSTTTFYRYFPAKEDVVLDNDASPSFSSAAAARPACEPLAATIGAAMAAVVAAAEADRDLTLARMRLIGTVPGARSPLRRRGAQDHRPPDPSARQPDRPSRRRLPSSSSSPSCSPGEAVHRLPAMGSRTRRDPARRPG